MVYVKDLINATMDNCMDYKITIIGNFGVICEGFRSIVYFSSEEVMLRIGKIHIVVKGANLSIMDIKSGYIWIKGNIESVSKSGEGVI